MCPQVYRLKPCPPHTTVWGGGPQGGGLSRGSHWSALLRRSSPDTPGQGSNTSTKRLHSVTSATTPRRVPAVASWPCPGFRPFTHRSASTSEALGPLKLGRDAPLLKTALSCPSRGGRVKPSPAPQSAPRPAAPGCHLCLLPALLPQGVTSASWPRGLLPQRVTSAPVQRCCPSVSPPPPSSAAGPGPACRRTKPTVVSEPSPGTSFCDKDAHRTPGRLPPQ